MLFKPTSMQWFAASFLAGSAANFLARESYYLPRVSVSHVLVLLDYETRGAGLVRSACTGPMAPALHTC